MRLRRALTGLAVAALLMIPTAAWADDGGTYARPGTSSSWDGDEIRSHSMAGGAECGNIGFNADLIKGRTGSMLVLADYKTGCKEYHYLNYVGADYDETTVRGNQPARVSARERAWQLAECDRVGRLDVVNFFRYYYDTEINPADVRVNCTPYFGPD